MAYNRFVKPGKSGYMSQYVPTKLPFNLWEKNLAQKDAQVDELKAWKSEMDKIQAMGSEEAYLPEVMSEYLVGEDGQKIKQEFSSLQLDDYNRSKSKYNELHSFIDGLTQDDFVNSVASGEMTDMILKGNKMYQELQSINTTNEKRAEWLKKSGEVLQDNPQVLTTPWVMGHYKVMLEDFKKNPNYVPDSMPVIGKSIDRVGKLVTIMDKKKDSGYSKEDLQPGELYTRIYGGKGVTADAYKNFATKVLTPNSEIYKDIEAEADSWIATNDLNPEDRQAFIDMQVKSLIDTAKELKHWDSHESYGKKSQYTHENELINQENGFISYGAETDEYKENTSVNGQLEELDKVNKELNTLYEDLARFNRLKAQGQNITDIPLYNQTLDKIEILEGKKNNLTYTTETGVYDAKNRINYGDRNIAIQKEELPYMLLDQPELSRDLFTYDKSTQKWQVNQDQFKKIQNSKEFNPYKSIILDLPKTAQGQQFLNNFEDMNGLYQVYNTSGVFGTPRPGVDPKGVHNIGDYNQAKKGLISSGKFTLEEVENMNNNEVAETFVKLYKQAAGFMAEKHKTSQKRSKLNYDLDNALNTVAAFNPYQYRVDPEITYTLDKGDLNAISQTLNVEGSKVTGLDGDIYTSPEILEKIAIKLRDENSSIVSSVTGDGKAVIKSGLSRYDLLTDLQVQEMYAKGVDKGTINEDKVSILDFKQQLQEEKTVGKIVIDSPAYGHRLKNKAVNSVINSDASPSEKSSGLTRIKNDDLLDRLSDEIAPMGPSSLGASYTTNSNGIYTNSAGPLLQYDGYNDAHVISPELRNYTKNFKGKYDFKLDYFTQDGRQGEWEVSPVSATPVGNYYNQETGATEVLFSWEYFLEGEDQPRYAIINGPNAGNFVEYVEGALREDEINNIQNNQ